MKLLTASLEASLLLFTCAWIRHVSPYDLYTCELSL